jgi:hypothetical protein
MKKFKQACESPPQLKNLQRWFGSIITSPLIENLKSQAITPDGSPLEEAAAQYLIASPTLAPHERIEIYNQQYWWRLLSVLHNHFPLLSRLFGYWDFDQQIGVHYLQAYPPSHFSLFPLGSRLHYWLTKNYREKDRKLVLQSAAIDYAYQAGYVAKQLPHLSLHNLNPEDATEIALKPLKLQPHIKLFKCDGHYFLFRDAFLEKEQEFWLENDFPPLLREEKTYYFMIFRYEHTQIHWRRLTPGQYHLLKLFQKNTSLIHACNHLEMMGGPAYEEALANIQSWFQEWIANQWLTQVQ